MLGVLAATGVGASGANMMPILLGAVTDAWALDPGAAGLLGTLELVAGALGSLAIAPRAAAVSRRRLALGAGALAATGYLLSAAAGGYASLAFVRVATGVCCGLALAAGNAAAAGARDPDRLFALVYVLGGTAVTVVIWTMQFAVAPWGYRGGFALLGLLCVAVVPLYWLLPDVARPAPDAGRAAHATPAALATLGGILLISICGQGVWAFTERIGVRVGLELGEIAGVLALANLLGCWLGSGFAALLGTRFGRTAPLGTSIAALGWSQWLLVNAASPAAYQAAQIAWGFAFYVAMPYVMGLAAALDRQGRWTVAAGGVSILGAALGPAAAGLAMQYGGFSGLGWLSVVCIALALLLFVPVSWSLRFECRSEAGPSERVAERP
jgi:predicted MFS family arabinose efflux permease